MNIFWCVEYQSFHPFEKMNNFRERVIIKFWLKMSVPNKFNYAIYVDVLSFPLSNHALIQSVKYFIRCCCQHNFDRWNVNDLFKVTIITWLIKILKFEYSFSKQHFDFCLKRLVAFLSKANSKNVRLLICFLHNVDGFIYYIF